MPDIKFSEMPAATDLIDAVVPIVQSGINKKADSTLFESDWTTTLVNAATSKTTPVDADELGVLDSATSFSLKKLTWGNLKATLETYFDTIYQTVTAVNFGDFVVALTAKTTPVDDDLMVIADSEATGDSKKLTWANVKATLKTYFDTLYTGSTDPSTTVSIVDDFLGSSVWLSVVTGTGSSSFTESIDVGNVGNLTLSVSAVNDSSYIEPQTMSIYRFGGGEMVLEARVRFPTLSDGTNRYLFEFGFMNLVADSWTHGFMIRYQDNINGGRFEYASKLSGTSDLTDSGLTVAANTWYKLRIVVNAAATSAECTIDGGNAATLTRTMVTTTSRGLACGLVKGVGSSARTAIVDYMSFNMTLTTPR